MDFRVIIPARYNSSRLPGKALMDISGKPMLQHVYERAIASGASSVVIATDDQRIAKAAEKFNAPVCMTATEHPTGTDRIAQAIEALDYAPEDIVVNVQGDEPLIPPAIIQQVANNLTLYTQASVATLCERIHNLDQLRNPNIVKVVINVQGYALYFSRSVIPWLKKDEINLPYQLYYRHIGLYAYRVAFLQRYVTWPHCPLEEMEALEQLRVLWNNEKIHVDVAIEKVKQDVNTLEDLEKVRAILQ